MNRLQGRLRSLLAAEIAMIQFFRRFLGLCFLPMQAFWRLFSTLGMVTLRQFFDLPKNPLASLKYFFLLKPAINNNFKQQMENDGQLDETQLIQKIQSYDWKDVLQSKSGDTPTNAIYQLQPPEECTSKYYRLFRAMLNNEEISQRSFHLTTLMLKLKMSNYYAMMLRKRYFSTLSFDTVRIAYQLNFINHLLATNSKEYQLWTYKKHLFTLFKAECSLKLDFYNLQIQFLQTLLQYDSKNYHVWDYRLWLVTYFQREKIELESTYRQLFVEPAINKQMTQNLQSQEIKVQVIQWENCYSMWSFRYNLSKSYFSQRKTDQWQEFQVQQMETVINWLNKPQNLKNQCGWNYYIGIALNYASINNEKLNQILLQTLELFSKHDDNRFIGNVCLQLFQSFQQRNISVNQQKRKELIQKMKTIDRTRELYYDYLLKM